MKRTREPPRPVVYFRVFQHDPCGFGEPFCVGLADSRLEAYRLCDSVRAWYGPLQNIIHVWVDVPERKP